MNEALEQAGIDGDTALLADGNGGPIAGNREIPAPSQGTDHPMVPASVRTSLMIDGMRVNATEVWDQYDVGLDRLGRGLVRAYTGLMQAFLKANPSMAFEDPRNMARMMAYASPGMRAWRHYMPTGVATYHAQFPEVKQMDDGTRLDPLTRYFFRHSHDAVGLRSRADVLTWRVQQHLREHGKPLRWISIASGSGQTVYNTMAQLPQGIAQQSRVLMIDIDQQVMDFAQRIRALQEHDLPGVDFLRGDVFAPQVQEQIAQTDADLIDAMGLFEYLGDERAVALLRTLYGVLPPGGRLIFTNMLREHPQLHVHQRGLGWPGVIPRSTRETVALLEAAGIPLSHAQTFVPQDGVYAVYEVVTP